MANDAAIKPPQIPNENTSISNATDQQKVPPLRIVLNSAGNQKSSSATTTATSTNNSVGSQQTNTKKEKSQDAKTEGTVRVGGRVRIKLGTNKQQSSGRNNSGKSNETNVRRFNGGNSANDKLFENINEDSASSFSHLRRITRRSQRAVQPISNEDEESISSMTSADENLNTNNNQLNSDNIDAQDFEHSNPANLTGSAGSAGSNATNGSSNADIPRRYKRRKVESSESQSIDCDNLLGSQQNYRLPNQNSFQLFKNIRKQVDKKLKNLNNVSPKIPRGFRDYMITRGAYLLEGNKLGNGTNLFMNEDGGLNSAPMGKYRVLRHNRTNYSVPNRAKVPLGLPVNSPLYDLFVEQEKERYRMRMQHIKEREKSTLAAEQEIMRVYNQAALVAADQTEPFSACTMLKHQEIYNYMDSNGVTILCREDAQQDRAQPDGVRTRRRQHGHISPSPPSRKTSDVDDSNSTETAKKVSENPTSAAENPKSDNDTQQSTDGNEKSLTVDKDKVKTGEIQVAENNVQGPSETSSKTGEPKEARPDKDNSGICPVMPPDNSGKSKDDTVELMNEAGDLPSDQIDPSIKLEIKTEAVSPSPTTNPDVPKSPNEVDQTPKNDFNNQGSSETSKSVSNMDANSDPNNAEGHVMMAVEETSDVQIPSGTDSLVSKEDKRILNKEIFLAQLQEVDDKWEKIRHEMLVRHKNEAESLHAIQKLEWEWKTKEIGACDVRTNPVIDDTLVPKLNIYLQDY